MVVVVVVVVDVDKVDSGADLSGFEGPMEPPELYRVLKEPPGIFNPLGYGTLWHHLNYFFFKGYNVYTIAKKVFRQGIFS